MAPDQRKADALDEIAELMEMVVVLRPQLGPANALVALERLTRLQSYVKLSEVIELQ